LNNTDPIIYNISNSTETKLSSGAIAAIAVCVPVGVIGITAGIVAFIIIRKRRNGGIQKSSKDAPKSIISK
jgi:hypothetical protein